MIAQLWIPYNLSCISFFCLSVLWSPYSYFSSLQQVYFLLRRNFCSNFVHAAMSSYCSHQSLCFSVCSVYKLSLLPSLPSSSSLLLRLFPLNTTSHILPFIKFHSYIIFTPFRAMLIVLSVWLIGQHSTWYYREIGAVIYLVGVWEVLKVGRLQQMSVLIARRSKKGRRVRLILHRLLGEKNESNYWKLSCHSAHLWLQPKVDIFCFFQFYSYPNIHESACHIPLLPTHNFFIYPISSLSLSSALVYFNEVQLPNFNALLAPFPKSNCPFQF